MQGPDLDRLGFGILGFLGFRVENRMLDPGLDASIDGAWGWMKNGTMLTAEQQHGPSLLANKHKTKEARAHQR